MLQTLRIEPLEEWWHIEHSIRLARECLPEQTEGIREEILDPRAAYFVALVHGGVKGFAGLRPTGINRHIFEFPWCVVHPEYRRQGVGRALTLRRFAEVKKRGGRAVIMSTPVPRAYLRYGFETVRVIPDLWAKFLMICDVSDFLQKEEKTIE